ncbi:MAG: UDP-2,3-diacylglucosamine diphosphatase [Proteobacteria bacterium]|nr:UDP-2,3-diacylglucosamine diphosphatase [Pseudomonadota bacterium]
MPETTLFISDLHLSAYQTPLQELFSAFLQGPAKQAQTIYILGDLFDVWVGQDIHAHFYDKIAIQLKKLTDKGIYIYFMAGNRDFLLQKSFLKHAGIQKIPDPTLIDLYGKPTLLTHGDKLCTQDIAYQRYRKIAQHPLTKMIFLKLPKRIRANIANKLRLKSQQYQRNQSLSILDVCQDSALSLMQQYKVKQLIHGHVHRPCFHEMRILNTKANRFVLGDWHKHASFIISTPTQISLATFSPQENIQIEKVYAFEAPVVLSSL